MDEWIGVIAVVATARCILVPVAIGVGAWWRFALEISAGAILIDAVTACFGGAWVNERIVVIAVVAAAPTVRVAVAIRVRAGSGPGRHIEIDLLFHFVALRILDLDLDLPRTGVGILRNCIVVREYAGALTFQRTTGHAPTDPVLDLHLGLFHLLNSRTVTVGGARRDVHRLSGGVALPVSGNSESNRIACGVYACP